jgi:hypothetical protein
MTWRRRALSLVEIIIAIGILGVGLAMLATIFPRAINEHRANVDRSFGRIVGLQAKAQILIRPTFAASLRGAPGAIYALPCSTQTLYDADLLLAPYLDGLSSIGFSNINNAAFIGWRDIVYPSPKDSQLLSRDARYSWVGFYAKNPGHTQFTVFICRRREADRFVLQDAGVWPDLRAVVETPAVASDMQQAVPWKVPVTANVAAPRQFQYVLPNDPLIKLSELIPNGGRLLSQQTGRLYTVLTVTDQAGPTRPTITALEDVLAEPAAAQATAGVTYLWLVPGSSNPPDPLNPASRLFGKSPVVDVLCFAG